MNNGRWQPHEDSFVRDNVNKMTLEQMAEHLGKSVLAVKLYMHRNHIIIGQTVKRNIVQEMLRIKFRHPENFMPTRAFTAKSVSTRCVGGTCSMAVRI